MMFMVYAVSIVTFIILALLLGCTIESFKLKNPVSRSLGKYELVAILSIVFCYLSFSIPVLKVASLMMGLYCLFMDYSLFFLTDYVLSFGTNLPDNSYVKIVRIWYIVLSFFDAVFLLTSSFTGICFTLEPYILSSGISTYIVTFNSAIIYHLGLCYSVSAFLFVQIVISIVQTSKVYRSRFIMILLLFAMEFISNLLFILFPHYWIYDYSSVVYGIMVIVCFSVTFYSIPKIVKKRIVSIASESVSDAVICFDYKGKCIFTNDTAKKFYNANSDEWVITFLTSDQDYLIKTLPINIDNENHTCKVEYRRIYDSKKRILGSYIKLNDYTEDEKKIEMEEYRASHDALTGLYNRDFFFKEAQRILSAFPNEERYLICTDIKNFKMVNDLFGTKYGDSILKAQAEMLTKANFEGVIHGRISGDKFAMLIRKKYFNPEKALANSNRIKDFTKDINFPLTIYIGVYDIVDTTENVRSMYDKAYMALKNIPEGNNTRLAYYTPALLDVLMQEKNIVSRFEAALAEKQFIFYLQSQIDNKTNECVGAEALVRWNYPDGGILPPAKYIPILEKSGQIYKLDKYIWEEAVKLLKNWADRGIDKYISVNISVKDFYYLDIYKVFTELVEKYKVSPAKLNLEITESVVSGDNQNHKDMLRKLQEYGFKIEMDDFGSGYSSLNLLKDISMDVLKIDMEFLHKTENSDRAILIINSITKMAKELGMIVIAEGVENTTQVDFLSKAKVDLFQGFLYSKPISVEEFEKKYLEVE